MIANILNSLRFIVNDIETKYNDSHVVEESNRLLIQFKTYLEEEQINSAELGTFLLFIFNKKYGLTKFMSVVYPKPSFKRSMCQCLEILYLLINNFPEKIGKYIQEINRTCLLILKASNASSDEKVRTLSVIILGFERIPLNIEYMDHYVEVYQGLQYCLTLRIGDSILEKVYECIGLYIKHFDFTVHEQEQRSLRTSMFYKIKEEMLKQEHSKKLLSGLFIGLAHIFQRIPFQAVEDKVKIDELYEYIKTLTQTAVTNRIRTSSRAALIFLQQNMTLFGHKVFCDHKIWHSELIQWITKLGETENKVASKVLLMIYLYITKHFIKEKKTEFKSILKNYLIIFRKGLDKHESTNIEKQVYIHGIELFFKAAPALLTPTEMTNFSTKLLHSFKVVYITNQETTADGWALLPHHIQMINSVIISMGARQTDIELIKQSLIVMLKNYHAIPILHRSAAVEAFLMVLYSLLLKELFDWFLSDLIYQSVIWSCSHSHLAELELNEDNKKLVTVKDYMYFWNAICKMEFDKRYDDWGIDIEKRRHIFLKIVQKLIDTLFVSINKLDITMSQRDTNSTDIKELFEINRKHDFAIFLNIVDFYEEMITKINSNVLSKFIYKLINFFIEKSSLYPVISGFYRLLAACLKVVDNLGYLKNLGDEDNITDTAVWCRQRLSAYIRKLLVSIPHYRDELLIASLKVLFECPPSVVEELLPDCVPVFIAIFTIGRNYMLVADMGIKTLESWQKCMKADRMEEFLCFVVPALDAFLRSKSLAYSSKDVQKKIKTTRALAKRKMIIEIEPELVKLQRRMLRFVGRQSATVCESLVDCPRVVTDIWGSARYLKVTLPFEDVKLSIYLDKLVPKVTELALYCSDRKTRVMACELLQALVILFLGTTKQMTDAGQRELEGLLHKMSVALLELGCDSDEIVRQLFEPLFLQMVHWYSSPLQYKKCHSAVIIETLTDGVCSPTNANLRTFAGKCIGEFVRWTIKQSNESRLVDEPGNIKALVKKMRFFSTHPDHFKKLGAALIFNNFYVFLREEREMLNMFWLEIFQIFISSLHYVDVENKMISGQIFAALKHLQRVFEEKSELFNKASERRRKPPGFKGTRLINVAEYLVSNSNSKNAICREKCTALFSKIVQFVSETRSPLQSLTYISNPINWLKTNFESSLVTSGKVDLVSLLEWMGELERCLDGFLFVLKNGFLQEENLEFTATLKAVEFYLLNIASSDFNAAINLLEQHPSVAYFDDGNFSNKQEIINRKILKFCYHSAVRKCRISPLWGVHLFQMVTNMIFDGKIEDRGEVEMLLSSCLSDEKTAQLEASLRRHIQNRFDLSSKLTPKQNNDIKGLLFLKSSTFSQVIDLNALLPNMVSNFLAECLSKISNNSTLSFDEIELDFYSSVLEFGLKNEEEFERFVNYLYVVDNVQVYGEKIPFGYWLVNCFEEVVIFNILENFEAFLTLSTSEPNRIKPTVWYIKKVLTFLHGRRKSSIQCYSAVFEKFCDAWQPFDAYFCDGIDALLEGLEVIRLVNFLKRSDFCTKWLVSLIVRASELGCLRDDLHMTVEVLEAFFESFSPMSGQDCSQIRVEMDQILTKIEKTLDKNAQNVLIMTINKLFHALRKSKSSILFEFVVKAYLEFPKTEDFIAHTAVFQKFMLNVPESEQLKFLEIIVHELKVAKYSLDRRVKVGKNILMAVFQSAGIAVFEEFFVLHVKFLVEEMEENVCENNIGMKIVNFLLIELLFARLPVGKENEVNKRLQMAAFNEERNFKELLRFCLKYALNAFRDKVALSESEQEYLRLYRCCSYNALVSIATNALEDPNFHVKLFTRLEDGEDILWKGLVDENKTFKFAKDFTALPQKKKILVNIRKNMKENSTIESTEMESIRSQRIFKCSLSEDITKYDMTNATVRTEMPATSCGLTEIALDQVDVNDHECMATICVLINHLTSTNDANLDYAMEELPEWLKGLKTVLMKDSTPVNVKIFLIKIIENTSHIFMHYSKHFLTPVLKFLVDKCAGDDINFFVTDLVVMLANWSDKAVPQGELEAELATKLIAFLFDKLSLERRDMFKFNIQLIKIILQAWKDVVKIPEGFLRRIEPPTPLGKEIEIHLCSVLLINELFVFDEGRHTKFLNFLTQQLNSDKRSTYVPCSETLGLLLKKWNAKDVATGYSEIVEPILRRIWDADRDKCGYILEGITIHYPGFIKENHVVRLLSRLNSVALNSQQVFLKIILRAITVLAEVSEFKSENWERYINSASVEVQIVTLKLMSETLDILSEMPSFVGIVGAICEKSNSQNDFVRKLVFDILIKICTENANNTEKYATVVEICKDTLIDGLSVEDPELLSSIREFWNNSGILSNLLLDRFLQTTSIFYKPKNEHVVLGSSIYFITRLLENEEDFEKELFDHPLEDCRFDDYELSVSSGTQHPYSVPMFAETFLDTMATRTAPKRYELGEVKATQDYLSFASTLATNQNDGAISSFVSSQSELLFDTRQPEDVATFKDPNDFDFKLYKRRFLRDKSKISEWCANFEVKSNVEKGEKRISRAKQRDRMVCISRKYRKGDFPDIQIPLSSIMMPLKLLASENSDIAKIVYIEIFDNIKNKLDGNHWSRLTEAVANIFKNSTQFNTNLFRTLLDLVIVSESKIILDPYLVTESCLSSGLLSTGTLLIEGYIRNLDLIPQAKRFKGSGTSDETIYWIKLAELYKEMNEWDVVCAIFQDKVPCVEQLNTAICSESRKLWIDCQNNYLYLIKNHLTVDRRDFFYEAYFRCFANLGQWAELAASIKIMETRNQDYWDALWDDDWNQKKLLPWLMQAEMADMMYKEQQSTVFFENVNRSLCDSQRADLLKTDFPDHLALMWVMNGDLDTAEMYLESYADSFLSQWQILDPMFRSMRMDKMTKLRDCSSIYDFVDVYRRICCEETDALVGWLRTLRMKSGKGVPHSLVRHERSVLYNKQFIGLISSKLQSFDDSELTVYVKELSDVTFQMDCALMDAALRENNFYVARKYLKTHKNRQGMELYVAKIRFIRSGAYKNDRNAMLKEMLKSVENIIKYDMNSEKDHKFLLSTQMTSFDILEQVCHLTKHHPELLEQNKAALSHLIGQNVSKGEELIDYIAQRLSSFLEHTWKTEGLELGSIAEAYVKLAYYTSQEATVDASKFNTFVLRAMTMGSREARQLFPCILSQVDVGKNVSFIEESKSVPTWMFLGGIPQLLGCMNRNTVQAIGPIVLAIAQTYPQAIRYPYSLSRKNLEKADLTDVLVELDNLLLNEDISMFLKALSNVVVPSSLLFYYINRIIKHATVDEENEVKELSEFVCTELFEYDPDSTDPEKFQGNVFKKMSAHTKELKQIWRHKKDVVIKKMQDLKEALQNDERKKTYSSLLRDYCPRLANFTSSDIESTIEVPGQYTGEKMPILQHHVKIRKFHPQVKIMDSQRKPIKITILGDNTKEYSYLLKFGEDIRQDERVQQLFGLINEILANKSDDTRRMALATYKVIPLTTSLGLIKWLDNTESLQEFMRKGIKNKKDAKLFPNGPRNSGPLDQYYQFINSCTRSMKTVKEAFGKSAEIYDRNKTIGRFRSLVNGVEPDLLRKAFWMLSTSTESFVALRHNFMRSYASMCTAHWLLGIGDRHLGNTLISLDDGRVIGIDFGHAFGTATQCLDVPELVPFRLTPQIVDFMEPFKEKGHFRESMIHTLRCVRQSKKMLLTTMNVFINEPSLDWLDKLKKEDDSKEEQDADISNWYPALKIEQARRKMDGVHPTVIMVEELESGQVKEYFDAYRRLVEGVAQYDYRAQVSKIDLLTEEHQADCLIDQAGDYNLLGRMFYGWRPWV